MFGEETRHTATRCNTHSNVNHNTHDSMFVEETTALKAGAATATATIFTTHVHTATTPTQPSVLSRVVVAGTATSCVTAATETTSCANSNARVPATHPRNTSHVISVPTVEMRHTATPVQHAATQMKHAAQQNRPYYRPGPAAVVVRCCNVLQCAAVCCIVLQCVAVCCSALHVSTLHANHGPSPGLCQLPASAARALC